MNKRITLLLIALAVAGVAAAQSNIRWSNFFLDRYSINPAAVDKYLSDWKVGGQFRNQWTGLEGAPRTGSLLVTGYWHDIRSQVGLRFMRDKIGYTHATDAALTYAFNIDGVGNTRHGFANPWRLNFGVGIHAQNFYYDTDQIVFEDGIVPENLPYLTTLYEKKQHLNCDFGVEFTFTHNAKEFLVGFASQNFVSYFHEEASPFANTNFGYAQGNLLVNWGRREDVLVGGVAFMHSQNQADPDQNSSAIYQWEFNLKYRLDRGNSYFSPGILFRTKETWAPSTREFGFIAEYEFGAHTLSGTYEISLSPLTQNTAGTFEIVYIVRFMQKSVCKPRSGLSDFFTDYKPRPRRNLRR